MIPLGISLGYWLANYLYALPTSHMYRKDRLPQQVPGGLFYPDFV